MSFACQRNSYIKKFDSKIVSCKPSKLKLSSDKKSPAINGFDVVMEDTILFPEGGGQNSDHGTLNGHPVHRVIRDGPNTAVHFVEAAPEDEFEVGEAVCQVVDWERRFQNMQQHSGQHLLSAVLKSKFGIATTSWWMAENTDSKVGISNVELDAKAISDDVIEEAEMLCNAAIRSREPVNVKTYDKEDKELGEAYTRGLPEDHVGPVRVIEIGSGGDGIIDRNMCCGTHVSNLSELQAIKILSVDKGKKGKCLMNFVVGERLLKYLDSCHKRQSLLTDVLKGGPEEHVELAEKISRNAKTAQKSLQAAMRNLAEMDAKEAVRKGDKYTLCYKKFGDFDYISSFMGSLGDDSDILACVIVGDDKVGPCQMVIRGKEEDVQDVGPKIVKLLDGKGGGKGNKLNAKVNSLKELDKVEDLLKSLSL